jgi:hypothetical protein
MKMTATVVMMLAMGACAQAGEKIRVYVHGGYVLGSVLVPAEDTAKRMFAAAGVAIEWHFGTPYTGRIPQENRTFVVDFSVHTPPEEHPGALAYSRPYEGIHIVVLYDRFQRTEGRLLPALLAHVIVHELTHLIEGIPRHSESGVVKAHWDSKDYCQMLSAPLPFAPEDIELIHSGLRAREAASDPPGPPLIATAELP